MGKNKPLGEGTAINQEDGAYRGGKQNCLARPISLLVCAVFTRINICIHNALLGYNKPKFNSILEAASMLKHKAIKWEISHAY